MAAEVVERFSEQMSTTAETLRRRAIAYYDGVFTVAGRAGVAVERLRDVSEPIAYDLADYTSLAVSKKDPVDKLDVETKNSVVEMYLGISVVLIGLSCGQLAGALAVAPLLEGIFDRYVEWIAFALLPVYSYLYVKAAALDDVERRTTLFFVAGWTGVLGGHLFGRSLLSVAPSVMFLAPMIVALVVDNELMPSPMPSMDRHAFLAVSCTAAAVGSAFIAFLMLGEISVGIVGMTWLHAAFLAVHFQITMHLCSERKLSTGEMQFGYIMGLFILQLVCAGLLGSSGISPAAAPSVVPTSQTQEL